MLHNLDGRTLFGFCGVFWTLALEEQLYLAYFPLLWLRTRHGWKGALSVCLAARLAVYFVGWFLKRQFGLSFLIQPSVLAQWPIWALGAISVEAHFGIIRVPDWARSIKVALPILLATSVVILWDRAHPGSALSKPIWFGMDLGLGAGFFVLTNYLVDLERRSGTPWFNQRWAIGFITLGAFSYSLYLTHQLWMLDFGPMLLSLLSIQKTPVTMLPLIPIAVLFAWTFYLLCERPFVRLAHRSR
jgi:peptidoglycan/LPS O-acetylase OafA/YrhL